MTVRRLLITAAAMTGIAAALHVVAAPPTELIGVLGGAPGVFTTAAAEDVVLAAAGLLAWLVWSWGALGLLLTAASGAPGLLGWAAGRLARRLVPAGLRSAMAVAVGVGLGVASPAMAAATPTGATTAATAGPAAVTPATMTPAVATPPAATGNPVPDWPAGDPAPPPVPEWPTAAADERHVVATGDCLWLIAAQRLTATGGSPPSDADVARAVDDWWQVNRGVIGPDPDLIHPGQVLRAPPPDQPSLPDQPPSAGPTPTTRTSDTPGSTP
jgi:hypothetical protein